MCGSACRRVSRASACARRILQKPSTWSRPSRSLIRGRSPKPTSPTSFARRFSASRRGSETHPAMTGATAGPGMKWVGRAIRRLEDPALVAGRGRFTGDLNAALWVRFIRSPVASGRIVGITASDGARIYRAADLDGVRPIRPMLHKFNYQPVEQPILAAAVVRFVGEPIAAVVASSPAAAEDIAEAVAGEIAALASGG